MDPDLRTTWGRWMFAALVLLASCTRDKPQKPPLQPPASPVVEKPAPKPLPRFRRHPITTPTELLKLREALGEKRFAEVLKLNRIDLDHARQGDALIIPNAGEDWLALAPFPAQWKEVEDQPKLIAVSLRLQAWAAFEGGRLVRWGPCSTGKKATPTYAGLYHTNWCQKERRSTFNDEWELKWYVNLHNWNGISFHRFALPGYPDSHSCVRLAEDDSEWIYYWCKGWTLAPDQRRVLTEGTPVIVFGDYGWGAPKPWQHVIEEPAKAMLGAEELAEALRLFKGNAEPPLFPDPSLRSQATVDSE